MYVLAMFCRAELLEVVQIPNIVYSVSRKVDQLTLRYCEWKILECSHAYKFAHAYG